MRPVNGTAGKSEKQSGDTDKKSTKRDAERSRAVRLDADSSEETQSYESSGKSSKSSPKVKTKQLPKKKQVSVAPHSTTYDTATNALSSSKPIIRASKKRDDYQSTAAREKMIGKKGAYRKRETNLQVNHPELKSLQSAQRRKEVVDRSKVAGGYLEIELKHEKDVDLLVAVLKENPSIHSLKLVCDLGGESGDPDSFSRNLKYENLKDLKKPDFLDHESLQHILNACKHIDTLDIKGCRLSDQSWKVLADKLLDQSSFVRLELGGGDGLSQSASETIYAALASGSSSLRELIIDDLSMDFLSFGTLIKGMKHHGNLSIIKLENIRYEQKFVGNLKIDSLFELCECNPNLQYLSLAGTPFRIFAPANDDSRLSIYQSMARSDRAIAFNAHACLRVLDLTNCGLHISDMSEIVNAAKGHAALIEIRTEGNSIYLEDRRTLSNLGRRNRELLQKQASAALDLLADHAAHQIETWPRELSDVLAQKASPMVLDVLASLIGKDAVSQSDKSVSNNLKPSESDS